MVVHRLKEKRMALHGLKWLEEKPGNWLRKEFLIIVRKHLFQTGGSWIKAWAKPWVLRIDPGCST